MPTDNHDRAEREIEQLRELFAASGRPRTSSHIERVLKAKDATQTQQAQRVRDGQRALPGGSGPMRPAEADAERRAARLADAQPASIDPRGDKGGDDHEPGQGQGEDRGPSRAPSSPPTPHGSVAMSAIAPDRHAGELDRDGRRPSSQERPTLPGPLEPRPPKAELTRLAEADRSRSNNRHDAVASGGEQRRRGQRILWAAMTLALALVAFAAGLRVGQESAGPQALAVSPSPVADRTAPPPSAEGAQATMRACLDTARYGDAVIAMLTQNIRDRRLEEAMKAYAVASRQCRSAASP